ncbi:MAG: acetyl-CoA carboxylase carboxyltransferase subunit alpha [Bdellovibrionales bacterium GWB1_52_6]|nr:MAG: acetyl-CoA carboxylase carboxyltransferase subunit alpha [Bdellovibrionales bacterium GWB1_52_6]OFZ04178.1 MAG: acetyl-CoA carboxylase carboxyltransferase subunit alpha [Bdellovibrionales bacterium GWA1_52_35]HCM40523.1 acetyl-CoA carboxylase carboxyl transferase subunit alpha [Bdellovibrionales bacterium]
MEAFFEFEKPIVNLEKKLKDLQDLAKQEGVDFSEEIKILEKKVEALIDETYTKLTPWQKVQLSRHPNRPYTRDYIDALFPDFMELHGDRTFGEDQAILGGVASWPPVLSGTALSGEVPRSDEGRMSVMILGHQKGRSTKQKMERNFGMARAEGYRKAMRLMALADRLKMPVLTFIDTPGAYPGIEAEERGQSQAIAESIHSMFSLNVPVVCVVIGEGGSGGALALGVGNTVLMQEYSIYSVISPESCASILWSNSGLAEQASERLKLGPQELLKFGVIDSIIPEPKGGAHRDWPAAYNLLGEALIKNLEPLLKTGKTRSTRKLSAERIAKFRKMSEFALAHAPSSPPV